ncbi:MAG: hypothetical protein KTR17_12565 [Cellvibrionaceae bacterium]|nr:hypothetical protein [Cellvibrionaceae bacterium]
MIFLTHNLGVRPHQTALLKIGFAHVFSKNRIGSVAQYGLRSVSAYQIKESSQAFWEYCLPLGVALIPYVLASSALLKTLIGVGVTPEFQALRVNLENFQTMLKPTKGFLSHLVMQYSGLLFILYAYSA